VYEVDRMPVTCPSCIFQRTKSSNLYALNASTPFDEEEEVLPAGTVDNELISDASLIIIIVVTFLVLGLLLYVKVTKNINDKTKPILTKPGTYYTQLA